MDADRQIVLVHIPQQLKDELGQEARVGEDQRGPVAPDLAIKLRDSPAPGVPAPGHDFIAGKQYLDLGRGALLALDQRNRIHIAPRGQPGAKPLRIGNRCRKRRALHIRRNRLQAAERQRQQIAAFAGGEGVNLVHHHALEAAKHFEAVGIRQQQRQAFGRGQQHMRRAGALALLAV